MTENKTQRTKADVTAFIDGVENATRRADARVLLDLMARVTGEEPVMWGPTMIGFGEYHYKYASGRAGDWLRTGFSSRKANMAVYIMPGFGDFGDLLQRLGKHKTSVSCLSINKLADVDLGVLEELVAAGWRVMGEKYGG